LAQAEAEQTFGFQQQFDFVQIQGDLVGLVFPGQLIQRRGQLGNRQHPGHRRTALEGVQGALQLIAGLQRHVFGRLIEEAVEAVQMGFGFFAEDLQQQRIKGRDDVFGGQRFLALGQGMGAGGQLVDVVALALAPAANSATSSGSSATVSANSCCTARTVRRCVPARG
jgi:hypothetical protein